MADTGADSQALLRARFGIDLPGTEVPEQIASLIDRRVVRRYTEQDVPDSLLDALLAAAQSAPAKSDLQQFSVVVMRDGSRIKQIADWIGTMDWIATAPVFLVWCGDMRRGQRLCAMHDMPHANNNMDTFLNTAVDCTLAMGQFMAAADAVGLGTCPISYVRSHIERVSPLLGLLLRRLPVGRPERSAGACSAAPSPALRLHRRRSSSHRERYGQRQRAGNRSRRLTTNRRHRPRPRRRRRPEEQRRLPTPRRRRLERECRPSAFRARTFRLLHLPEDEGFRSCLMMPPCSPAAQPSAPNTPPA